MAKDYLSSTGAVLEPIRVIRRQEANVELLNAVNGVGPCHSAANPDVVQHCRPRHDVQEHDSPEIQCLVDVKKNLEVFAITRTWPVPSKGGQQL